MRRYVVIALFVLFSCSEKTDVIRPQSFEELGGMTMSLMEGSIEADYCMEHLKDKGITFSYYPSITDCALAVYEGRADVFFGNNLQIYNEEFKRQHLEICHYVDEIYAPFGFGVKKGNKKLLNELNSFIRQMSEDGSLDEAKRRWFNENNTDFHDCIVVEPCPAEPEDQSNVLKVGISGVKQPAEVLIDNKWTGYEIELLQRFAEKQGKQLQILVFDFHNLVPSLESGTVDVVAATLVQSEDRKKNIDFADPVAELKTVFIVRGVAPELSIWQRIKESAYVSLVKENRYQLIIDGLETTMLLTFLSLVFGSLLGAVVCWMRLSKKRILSDFAKLYLYIMRNIPMLVFLMLMFYVFLSGTGLNPITVAIVAFSMNSAAFISEIFRTGILSVDRGQVEASRALGCTKLQTFVYIVIPQAARKILPVFKNESVSLLKGTSIVGYISILDLTKGSDLIRSASFEAFFPLIVITILYFVLASILTFLLDRLIKLL